MIIMFRVNLQGSSISLEGKTWQIVPLDFLPMLSNGSRRRLIVVTNLRNDIAHQIHAHIGADTQITQANGITT